MENIFNKEIKITPKSWKRDGHSDAGGFQNNKIDRP
jgi:hypothetical protein